MNFKKLNHRTSLLVFSLLISNLLFGQGWHSKIVFADAGHSHGEEISGGGSEYPIVTVMRAQTPESSNIVIEASGQVLSSQESDVFPLRDGIVQELYVNVGDSVKAGQVIGYLYPSVDQTILNADLSLAQAQREAAQKRLDLLKDIQEVERIQLESSLGFARENLSLSNQTTDELLAQINTQISVSEEALISDQEQYAAEVERLDVQIRNARQQLSQKQVSLVNGISDLVFSVEAMMYVQPGIITGQRSYDPNLRRFEVYNFNREEFATLQNELTEFYRDFSEFQEFALSEQVEDVQVLQDWLDRTLEIAKQARVLSNGAYVLAGNEAEISALRDDFASAVDHPIDLFGEVIDDMTQISEAQAEQIVLTAQLDQQQVALQGQIDVLTQEQVLTAVNQEVALSEKNSQVANIENQLEILEKGFENQRIDAGLNIEVGEAQEKSIRQKIGAGRSIIAPFSGVISRRYVNEGASVGFGQPIFHLVNDSEKFIRFFVNESDFAFISKGQSFDFSSTASDLIRSTATIQRIAPSLDQDTRTVLVEASLDDMSNEKILSNMTVRLQIPIIPKENVSVVPSSAVSSDDDGFFIWFTDNDLIVKKIPVELHFTYGDVAYVEADLDELWIITKSPVPLAEGLEIDTTL